MGNDAFYVYKKKETFAAVLHIKVFRWQRIYPELHQQHAETGFLRLEFGLAVCSALWLQMCACTVAVVTK